MARGIVANDSRTERADMRRILVAGNWKMNTGRAEALALAEGLVERHGQPGAVDV